MEATMNNIYMNPKSVTHWAYSFLPTWSKIVCKKATTIPTPAILKMTSTSMPIVKPPKNAKLIE